MFSLYLTLFLLLDRCPPPTTTIAITATTTPPPTPLSQDEEQKWWPQLHAKMTREELITLHDRIEAARPWAPTHPHPGAPGFTKTTGVLPKVVNPVLGAVDRAGDALLGRSRPEDAAGGAGSGATSLIG